MTYKEQFDAIWNSIVAERLVKISRPDQILGYCADIKDSEVERVKVILLNWAHEVIHEMIVSQGTINRSLVYPREVFREAVKQNAATIILVHNHPSGSLEPSVEDRAITKKIVSAGEILGIPLMDHVIVSERGYYSFMEEGML